MVKAEKLKRRKEENNHRQTTNFLVYIEKMLITLRHDWSGESADAESKASL